MHRSYHQNVKESLRLIYILYTKSQHHVKRINSHNYNSSCAHTPRQVNMFFLAENLITTVGFINVTLNCKRIKDSTPFGMKIIT